MMRSAVSKVFVLGSRATQALVFVQFVPPGNLRRNAPSWTITALLYARPPIPWNEVRQVKDLPIGFAMYHRRSTSSSANAGLSVQAGPPHHRPSRDRQASPRWYVLPGLLKSVKGGGKTYH